MMKKAIFLVMLVLASQTTLLAGGVVVRIRPVRSVRVRVVTVGPRLGRVDINCSHKKAAVFVNGDYVGRAGSFDGFPGKLNLKPGRYTIKIKSGKTVFSEKIRVLAGREINLNVVL